MSDNNDKEKSFSRRDFLKTTGAATGGIIGGSLLGGFVGFNLDGNTNLEDEGAADEEVSAQADDNQQNFQNARTFFKRQEDFDVLSYATETIYPEDDNGPGAIELDVPYFIDKQLAGIWGSNGKNYMRPPFQEGETALNRGDVFLMGIRLLNQYSNENFNDDFYNLNEDNRVEILETFESGEVENNDIDTGGFFQLLRQATIEGAYSDPIYGGNKNMEGWRMKEFPGAQTSYRDRMSEDEDIDADFVFVEPRSLSDQN